MNFWLNIRDNLSLWFLLSTCLYLLRALCIACMIQVKRVEGRLSIYKCLTQFEWYFWGAVSGRPT